MNRIAKLRKERKLTQKEFGKIMGVAQNTICNWETGKREPDFETAVRIADYFHVSTDYLFGHVNNPFFHLDNDRVKREINSYDDEEEKAPTPVSEDGPMYPPEYDLLSPEDKALVDNMIRSLARAIQPDPPQDKADEDIDREVEDYRRRLMLEKKQRDTSSPSSEAGDETA